MKRFFRRTGVGAFGLALVSASLGCSTPPPPPKVLPKPPVVVAVPPPPPPLPPAKWMQIAGATAMGPQVDGGRLMLVGGRRILLLADGSTKAETSAAAEPLHQVVVVPVAGGAKRIIARGTTGLYRLDDPLGAPKPLAQSESDIRAIASYSGLVVVWTYNSDSPRFVDVETGKFKLVPTLPPLPIRTVAFRSEKEGAALFEAVGLAVTTDGGVSWKRVSEDVNGDALRLQGLTVRDGSIYGYVFEDGMQSPIDLTQARVGRAVDPPAEANLPALVRWVRATGTDPIAAAASGGIETSDGVALVASNGLIARVDLKSGTVTAMEEFAHEPSSTPCNFQRAGSYAWLACPIAEQPNSDVYEPFGIMRVPLDGNNIKPERPAVVRSGEAELRTSPSGGVLIMGQCNPNDSEGEVCARQPDGRWVALTAEVELSMRGVGPLSDGRVAFLRNMWDGDKPESHVASDEPEEEEPRPDDESEEPGEDRMEREVPEGKRVYIAAVGDGHKEQRIATLSWRPRGDIRVQSPIQEDGEHNLHFIVADDEGVYAVVQPMDKEARIPQRLEGMMEARLRGSRGIAVGADGIRSTTDGGRTWVGVPLPTRARDALGSIDSMASDPSSFGVSEVGLLLDKSVRIGWGASDTIDEPIEPVFDSILPSISRVTGPEKLLTCSVEANVQGTPVPAGTGLVSLLLGTKTPAPKGTRRATNTATSTRDSLMGAAAYFNEEGPDKPGSFPTKWTLSWFDPAEVGGKPRTWSGAPPKNTSWGTTVRAVVGSGARALFTMRVGGKNMLIRTKGAGIETAEVTSDLLPSNDVVFGTDKGEPIAWTRDNSLIVWISGEAPRVIGQVSYRSTRLLGEPTKDGVPVLVSAQDWSALRVFPIPAMDKKGPAPTPLAPTLDGWSATPNLAMQLGRFPVCTTKPKGALHFSLSRSYARAVVDTAMGSLSNTRYEVYLAGAEACVAQMGALYSPDRSSSRQPPPSTTNGPKKAPITFVRADFLAKRAEGGTRGLPAKDAMHKLTCTLEERK